MNTPGGVPVRTCRRILTIAGIPQDTPFGLKGERPRGAVLHGVGTRASDVARCNAITGAAVLAPAIPAQTGSPGPVL